MSIAQNQKMMQIAQKVELLAAAVAGIGMRLSALEQNSTSDLLERISKLEGEIKAMKARMGKIRETVE